MTNFEIYALLSQASADFKRAIFNCDSECVYHTRSKKVVADEKIVSMIWDRQKLINEMCDEKVKEIKEANADAFQTTYAIASIAPMIESFLACEERAKFISGEHNADIIFTLYKKILFALDHVKGMTLPKIEKKICIDDTVKEKISNCKLECGYKTKATIEKEIIEMGYITEEDSFKLKPSRIKFDNSECFSYLLTDNDPVFDSYKDIFIKYCIH